MKYFIIAALLALAGCGGMPSTEGDWLVTCPEYGIEKKFYDVIVWSGDGSIVIDDQASYPADLCFIERI